MDREHVQSVERTIIVLWDILSSALPGDRESNIEDIVILFRFRSHQCHTQTALYKHTDGRIYIIDV